MNKTKQERRIFTVDDLKRVRGGTSITDITFGTQQDKMKSANTNSDQIRDLL